MHFNYKTIVLYSNNGTEILFWKGGRVRSMHTLSPSPSTPPCLSQLSSPSPIAPLPCTYPTPSPSTPPYLSQLSYPSPIAPLPLHLPLSLPYLQNRVHMYAQLLVAAKLVNLSYLYSLFQRQYTKEILCIGKYTCTLLSNNVTLL